MSSEQSFGYNGPLSTFSEWHSLIAGLAVGVAVGWSKTLLRDLQKEPHYAIGAFLIGVALGWAAR